MDYTLSVIWKISEPSAHIRYYSASRPDVAVKKYLNYLRRYTDSRPTEVKVSWNNHEAKAEVQWYEGKLEDGVLKSDHTGTWWKLIKVKEGVT